MQKLLGALIAKDPNALLALCDLRGWNILVTVAMVCVLSLIVLSVFHRR
jgi:hypothetical protein